MGKHDFLEQCHSLNPPTDEFRLRLPTATAGCLLIVNIIRNISTKTPFSYHFLSLSVDFFLNKNQSRSKVSSHRNTFNNHKETSLVISLVVSQVALQLVHEVYSETTTQTHTAEYRAAE